MITALAAVLAMTAGLLTYLSLDQRSEAAASLPDGFLIEESPSGQEAQLTDFAYTPDGGYFTTSKTGHIAWVSAAGQVVPQADVDVESIQDLGLTGIAVAPDFATSRTVYTARTTSLGKLRLSAWQAQGTGTPAGLTGERVVMEADRRSDVHAITGVLAEADGTLWVTIGDSADFRFTDPAAFDVQNPDTPYGKIFHINPDGTGVAGNPAYDGADPASWRSRMYANGFRSPFRMSIDPGTGAPIMGDVGWMTWEEVNFVQPGNNYGWPCWEGDAPTAGYTDRDECAGSTAAGPLYTYRHAANSGASVTGGIVYTGLNYPKQYRGLYFFGDYSRTSIETLRLRDDAGQPVADPTAEGFGLNIGGPVRFGAAENGDIVFADIYDSTLKRIVYKPGNRPPVAKATSVVDPATRTVSFDATASSDLDGDPLTYTWDFGDGEKGQGAQTTHVYPDSPHDFTATVTVADDKGGSGTYALKVVPSNNAPKIEWTAPPEDAVFKVGDPVRIDATATDVEDGPLTMRWEQVMVHCAGTGCHDHPSEPVPGGLYDRPFVDHGDDTYLRLTATATDAEGVTTQRVYIARPKLVTMTVRSNTPANVTINGRVAHTTTVTSGAKMSLEAPAVATDGVATFKAWAQGGDRTFTMTMPDRDTVLDVAYETPIDKRYDSDEAFRKLLGAPIGEELGADVRFREFQNGRAYWSKDAGVHSIGGAILQNYLDQGGSPAFGPPVTDEMVAADGVGRYSTFGFESASYWSPQTGAHVVHGQNFLKWQASGLEQGPLGYPTTDEGDTGRPGGRYNDFQNGTVVWSPGTGSHLVTGEIYKKYAQYNWDWGVLGFPTTDEGDTGRPGGRYNNFQNGTVIWSPGTGAHLVTGAILAKYGAQGWDQGSLAFPTTDELDTGRPGGRFNNFQGGTIIWSAQTGAQQVQGAILQKYGEYGWDGGRLAFPTTSEVALRNGAYTHFQGGSVYWSAPTGAHALFGAIKDRWAARGWENSYLGYPTSEEFAVPGGVRQNFQGGYVVWTASTGAVTDQRY